MPELEPYLESFTICSGQVRSGMAGICGIDFNAFIRVAGDLGVVTDEVFYVLLQTYERTFLEALSGTGDNNKSVQK